MTARDTEPLSTLIASTSSTLVAINSELKSLETFTRNFKENLPTSNWTRKN